MKNNKSMALTLIVAGILFTTGCGGASDPRGVFQPPETEMLIHLGQWAVSTPLTFRLIKISTEDSIPFGEVFEQATKGNHFVVARLQVLPAQKRKLSVDYTARVRLLDAEGEGYIPDPYRFKSLNNLKSTVMFIESGKFVEYDLAFLVPRDFEPAALRCEGAQGAEPAFLALKRD